MTLACSRLVALLLALLPALAAAQAEWRAVPIGLTPFLIDFPGVPKGDRPKDAGHLSERYRYVLELGPRTLLVSSHRVEDKVFETRSDKEALYYFRDLSAKPVGPVVQETLVERAGVLMLDSVIDDGEVILRTRQAIHERRLYTLLAESRKPWSEPFSQTVQRFFDSFRRR